MIEICEELENNDRRLIGELSWPSLLDVRKIIAQPTTLQMLEFDEVTKIDFDTHIKGRIIDCAFTPSYNPKYEKLLEAVKYATNTGIRETGVDVR